MPMLVTHQKQVGRRQYRHCNTGTGEHRRNALLHASAIDRGKLGHMPYRHAAAVSMLGCPQPDRLEISPRRVEVEIEMEIDVEIEPPRKGKNAIEMPARIA